MIRVCDNGHPATRVQSGTRCPACSRRRESGRPSRQARGYDATHDQARNTLRAQLPALCAYGCGVRLEPYGVWVAAHVIDGEPTAGWVAACVLCNERAKGTTAGAGREVLTRGVTVPAPSQQRARMTLDASRAGSDA